MSDRLRQLQHQQSLVREHLAWIDREVARESSQLTSSKSPTADSPPLVPVAPTAIDLTDADTLVEKYAAGERQNPSDIRRGCLIVFGCSLGLLITGVAALWMLFYS